MINIPTLIGIFVPLTIVIVVSISLLYGNIFPEDNKMMEWEKKQRQKRKESLMPGNRQTLKSGDCRQCGNKLENSDSVVVIGHYGYCSECRYSMYDRFRIARGEDIKSLF